VPHDRDAIRLGGHGLENCVIIFSGFQSDQTYSTSAPVSAAAAMAPLYTTVSKPPPGAPPGKNTILVPEHQPPSAAGAAPSVVSGWAGTAGSAGAGSAGAAVGAGAQAARTSASEPAGQARLSNALTSLFSFPYRATSSSQTKCCAGGCVFCSSSFQRAIPEISVWRGYGEGQIVRIIEPGFDGAALQCWRSSR